MVLLSLLRLTAKGSSGEESPEKAGCSPLCATTSLFPVLVALLGIVAPGLSVAAALCFHSPWAHQPALPLAAEVVGAKLPPPPPADTGRLPHKAHSILSSLVLVTVPVHIEQNCDF